MTQTLIPRATLTMTRDQVYAQVVLEVACEIVQSKCTRRQAISRVVFEWESEEGTRELLNLLTWEDFVVLNVDQNELSA